MHEMSRRTALLGLLAIPFARMPLAPAPVFLMTGVEVASDRLTVQFNAWSESRTFVVREQPLG